MLTSTYERQSTSGVATSFAAVRLNLKKPDDQDYLNEALAGSKAMSQRAWRHYQKLGTVRYPLNRAARLAGSAKLKAVFVDDEGKVVGDIKRGDELDAAIDAVANMYSPISGVRGLIERYFIHMKVPADSHLIRVKDGRGYDGYQFLSPDELTTDALSEPGTVVTDKGMGDLTWITRPGGMGRPEKQRKIARKDYLGRVYQPSARFIDMPDPVLYTLDGECDLLLRMQTMMRAHMRSRAATAGILFLPKSLQTLASGKRRASGLNDLVEEFNTILSENLMASEDGDAADVSSIVIAGDDDAGEKIREIILGQATQETDLKLRSELFENILFALDINTRASKGNQETRFQNWNDTSDELRLAVIPDLDALAWTLTRLALHRTLQDETDLSDDQILRTAVGIDLSEASVRINREDTANQLRDRLALSNATIRRAAGFQEGDKPDDDEYIRQSGTLTKNLYAMLHGIPLPDDWDWEKALGKPGGAPQDSTAEDPQAGPGQGDPGSPSDTKTADKPSKA